MVRLIPLGLAILIGLVISASCIVDTRPRRTARGCPPAYHWNGDRCVHNSHKGKRHKHKKHKHKKHRKHKRGR